MTKLNSIYFVIDIHHFIIPFFKVSNCVINIRSLWRKSKLIFAVWNRGQTIGTVRKIYTLILAASGFFKKNSICIYVWGNHAPILSFKCQEKSFYLLQPECLPFLHRNIFEDFKTSKDWTHYLEQCSLVFWNF